MGECGLDYHYDHSPATVQRDAFAAQIALAHERGLAARHPHPRGVGRHVRHPRGRGCARAHGVPLLHRRRRRGRAAASTSAPTCRSAASSRSRRPSDVRQAAALCPLDRLLVETDAPYLAPVPHRGTPQRAGAGPARGRRRRAGQGRRRSTRRGGVDADRCQRCSACANFTPSCVSRGGRQLCRSRRPSSGASSPRPRHADRRLPWSSSPVVTRRAATARRSPPRCDDARPRPPRRRPRLPREW